MRPRAWLAGSCLLGAAGLGACGSSTSGTGGSQATSDASSNGTTSSSTSSSSGSALVNGCDPGTTTLTTGDATVTFPTGASPMQYAPNCVKIKAGSKVTWNGAFMNHPLTPDGASNPIMSTNMGMTASFTFPAAGSFGFHCYFHPSVMLGAVFVE